MGRYYRRRRRSALGSLLLICLMIAFWPITVLYFLIKVIVKCVDNGRDAARYKKKFRAPAYTQNTAVSETDLEYSARDSLMTDCEKKFFTAFSNILGDTYILQPQVNLASIIHKDSESKYQNELFRNIDFGVFDREYTLKLLIEINDPTHKHPDRIERDKKVRAICDKAGIPLIAFWTQYGVNEHYIRNRLAKYLDLPGTQAEIAGANAQAGTYNGER